MCALRCHRAIRRALGASALLLGLSVYSGCQRADAVTAGSSGRKNAEIEAAALAAKLEAAGRSPLLAPQLEPQLAERLALLPPAPEQPTPLDSQLTALQDKARRFPSKLENWVLLGQLWVRRAREAAEPGYYRNADACADMALRLQAGSPLALNLRALVLMSDHRFADAQTVAEQILRRNDFDPMAWGTLSDALMEGGQIAAAEEAAQHMMALKPNLPSYSRASYLHFLRGRSREAKEAMRLAIDAASTRSGDTEPRAWAIVQAAYLFWHGGDYEGADAGFELALKTLPQYPPALVGRAQVALSQGRAADAVLLLARAYELSPLAETLLLLGDARRVAGAAGGAEATYAQLEKIGRRSDPRTLAYYFAKRGQKLDVAKELIDEERRGRADPYTLDVQAWVLFRLGQTAEARRIIDGPGVLGLGLRDARVLYHAAAIHAATGDQDGARRLAAEAVQLNPHFDVDDAVAALALSRTAATAAAAAPTPGSAP
jgi:tetratricopeptide (TPR) repeat protein